MVPQLVLPRPCIYKEGERSHAEISLMRLEALQDGMNCNVLIEEEFSHKENDLQEIRCIYPINKTMCLYDVKFLLGDEEIIMKLQEKKAAEEAYQEAISQGKTAIKGTRLNDSVVEFTVGNVAKGIKCVLSVKAIIPLQINSQKKLQFNAQLQIADISNGKKNLRESYSGPFQFSLRSSHSGAVIENGSYQSIPNEINSTISIGEIHSELSYNGQYAVVTALANDLSTIQSESDKDYAFIIDCSGSMSGERIKQAREALTYFLHSLPPTCNFEIVRFGSKVKELFSDLVPYNEDNLKRALILAENLQADLGGTNLMGPLKLVLDKIKRETQIFVVTDGEIWDTDKVISLVALHRHKARIFTLGVGSDVDKTLCSRMAQATMGRCDFASNSEQIGEIVLDQLETAMASSITDLQLQIEGCDDLECAPVPISPAYLNVPSTIIAKANSPIAGDGLITGKYNNEDVEIPLERREAGFDERAISALFAFKLLEDLDYQRIANPNVEIKKKMINLSVSSGILCDLTAFIGVSKLPPQEPEKVELHAMRCIPKMRCAPKAMMCFAAPPPPMDCATPLMACGAAAPMACGAAAPMACGAAAPMACNSKRMCVQTNSLEKSSPEVKDIQKSVISLQNTMGYWENVKDVAAAGEVSPSGLPNLDEKIKATILALAILRMKCGNKKALWKLIEKKALAWIKSTDPSIDVDAIIAAVSL